MTADDIFDAIDSHGADGVAFVTVHCGLTLESRKAGAYDDRQLSLLATIAQQIAVAVENARHFRKATIDSLTGFWGTIPMPRGKVPVRALRTAIDTIVADRPIAVFPEAKRTEFWGQMPPSVGAAWLGLYTGAPIYPVAMEGTEHVLSHREPKFRRSSVRATVCEPLDPLDFMDHVDPLGATIDAWQDRMIQVLGPLRTSI